MQKNYFFSKTQQLLSLLKGKIILSLVTLFLFANQSIAQTNESEPNNTPDKANVLPLNGSGKGKIDPAGEADWWKVKTNADGRLDITLTPLSGKYMWASIYDTAGVILLTQTYSTNTFTVKQDGLAAGTYFIKVFCYYGTDTSSYQISNALVTPAQANDVEPNNLRAQAKVLALNGSTTGHVGYYYDNHRDTADWYKVTTNEDGRLRVTLTPSNNTYLYATLYDNDGTSQLVTQYGTSTFSINQDGLAVGTYYVKVNCYANSDFAPYTLSDSLFTPAQAIDAEPNNSFAQAKVLPLNDSVTGHVGYYYDHYRDTADWYKVTTNKDGRLRVTLKPANGKYLYASIYDNDGTTLLVTGNSPNTFSINQDGLAVGTYYVKVNCYYNSEFAPYTLSDSLFTPAQEIDIEPNNTVAQAKVLELNSTTTGHVGYYYNNYRDTADWYKVTTNEDGMLQLTLTPANNKYLYLSLYDNDGTTLLIQNNSPNAFIIKQDGLAAGTYYVKVNNYYSSEFSPYTLSDSLFTYNKNDVEPNKYFSQAATLDANRETSGHHGFYYNNKRDTLDIWKINYTGTSGNLKLTLKLLKQYKSNTRDNTWIQVYKDTSAAPIYSTYTPSASIDVNLTNLTQQYYYIKIYGYYGNDFNAYAIADTFTQVNIAKIVVKDALQSNECGKNTLSFSLSKSHSPYTVRLYRDGVPYDSLKTTTETAAFSNLADGVYYATAYGDGATDEAFGTSANTTFLPPYPTSLTTTDIGVHTATLNWATPICMKDFRIQYKKTGAGTWTTVNTPTNNTGIYNLNGLNPYTDYTWQVASVNPVNGLVSEYTSAMFKTLSDTAKVDIASITRGNTCNSNSIQYNLSNSEPPYTVQLYRYGAAYGVPVSANANTIFSSLPQGVYYAMATGTGSGGTYGKSDTVKFTPPVPGTLITTNIGFKAATLNWSALSCLSHYSIQYKLMGDMSWTTIDVTNNMTGMYNLTGLMGDTTYSWRIGSIDSTGTLMSAYSETIQFFTKAGLPITLLEFKAQYQSKESNVLLTWKTATEQNNTGFELQRSTDGTHFAKIGFENGAGNSSSIKDYRFIDASPVTGQSFYRLKQIDADGKSSLSSIVPVIISSKGKVSFSPNPVKSQLTVRSSQTLKEVTLFNLHGQQIKKWKEVNSGDILNVSNLTPGMYLIKAILDGEMQTFKIVKE